ncbi:MAG: methyltransferase domain-containing protein, partial [Chloroflexota bacterium]
DAADLQPGQRVLDVACGTGVLARTAAGRVEVGGQVVGVDINEGMLAVAKQKAPHITWWHGPAENLPFEDNSFDAVISQFGLMFFEDRQEALKEMMRVLRPGGKLAVAVWDRIENTPGYAAMVALLQRLFGDEAADGLRAPYNLGDKQLLQKTFNEVGISNASIDTVDGLAQFASIKAWVFTDIKGWTLADMIDEAQFKYLLEEAEKALQPFVAADGSVSFKHSAHIVTTTK